MGAGMEETPGMADTPGWNIRAKDFIEIDEKRGIKLLRLKRSESRMKQTSFTMLQSWRANCDIALLIYTQDPLKINEKDIAAISGYVTSYCTKGNATHKAEIETISAMILSMKNDFSEGNLGTITAARKIFNTFMTDRIISKAESSCDILNLPLYKCTEIFRSIPLSTYTKIIQKKTQNRQGKYRNIVSEYSARTKEFHISLSEFFYKANKPSESSTSDKNRLLKRDNLAKTIIAHPTGLQNSASFPITWQYAKAALILHKPWNKRNRLACDSFNQTKHNQINIINEYLSFLQEKNCPKELRLQFEVAKESYERSIKQRQCAHNLDGEAFVFDENITQAAKEMIQSQLSFNNMFSELGLERGEDYQWDKPTTTHEFKLDDRDWIDTAKLEYEQHQYNQKILPKKSDNSSYILEDIENNNEQSNIVYSVIQKIKEWIEFEKMNTNDSEKKFEPLYITVQGAGGTGKSRTINVIITMIEQIFPTEKVTVVSAPTGAAAYNIGGSTCHRQFHVSVQDATKDLSQKSKNLLIKTLKHALVVIIDERSLLSMEVLGGCENNAKECCHDGLNKKSNWGNIPIVILFGDDYQLPSVVVNGKGKGSSYIIDENDEIDNKQKLNKIERIGVNQFILLSKNVIELSISHRIQENENELSSMLHTMRNSTGLTTEQATKLLYYNIQNDAISPERKQFLENEAIWIFYTNAKVDNHNFLQLKKIVNIHNPVCNCMGQFSPAQGSRRESGIRGHFGSSALKKTNSTLARGARVALDRNIWDCMGLYNGAMGTVIDIRFDQNKSPLLGDLPVYIIIDFDDYIGPSWDKNQPSYLPIPPSSLRCRQGCCIFTKMPLTLSWARTTHKFQGSQVGPEHPIKAMVFDPGKSGVEGNNPGFTYVGLSRVSSLGKGNINDSAFYLTGDHLSIERFTDMTFQRTRKNETYVKIKQKKRWIRFLDTQKQNTNLNITKEQKEQLKKWVTTSKFSKIQLENAIYFHSKKK